MQQVVVGKIVPRDAGWLNLACTQSRVQMSAKYGPIGLTIDCHRYSIDSDSGVTITSKDGILACS
jgi:hypothetical protein